MESKKRETITKEEKNESLPKNINSSCKWRLGLGTFLYRYFLTIIGGSVFAYAVINKILPPEATASIITMIFVSYFDRKDRQPTERGKNENLG